MNKNNNNNNNNNKNNSNIYSNRKKSNKNIIKINTYILINNSFINNHVQNLRWATYSENGIRRARPTSTYEKFHIYISDILGARTMK